MKEIDLNRIEIAKKELPTATFDRAIEENSVPYRVEFDANKCASFLMLAGLSKKQAGGINIHFKHAPWHPALGNAGKDNNIDINVGLIWRKNLLLGPIDSISLLHEAERETLNVAAHEAKHHNDILNRPIRNKVDRMASAVAGAAMFIGLNTLIHHQNIDSAPEKMIPTLPSTFVLGLMTAYYISPEEIRARRYANNTMKELNEENYFIKIYER